MDLPAIGRVENPDDLDLDPISIPLIGYTLDRKEVEQVFRFRPAQPAGATLNILKNTDANGNVPTGIVMTYLDECLLEDDREKWQEFLYRPDLMIEQSVLAQLYMRLTEVYAARPTPRWSDSGGGGTPRGRTSPGAQRSKPSTSRSKTPK